MSQKTNRELLDEQLEIQNKGKTPEQIIQESYEFTRNKIEQEKKSKAQEISDRISFMRTIFNISKPSNKLK